MKTAIEVIRRIQWDAMMPGEHFTIGYLDRFVGIVEEPFSRFSNWCDLPNAEQDALAIPQHRIQYFKYRDTKVWDRKSRVDHVFGSTGNTMGIMEFMDQIDDDHQEKMRRKYEETSKKVVAENAAKESDNGGDSNSDSDSEDSEDFNVTVNVGNSFSTTVVNTFPMENRSTHFLSIRITENNIVHQAKMLQDHIVGYEMALSECCMKSGLFHMTIGMLKLSSDAGIQEAITLVEEMTPILEDFKKQDLKLRISGLDTFGQRVLFGKVHPEPEDAFWELISIIQNKISETSPNVEVTNKFEFTPHLTVMKVNRAITRVRNSKYLPSYLYEAHMNMDFGVQPVNNLQLCILESTTRHDGFYSTLKEIEV
eukprot:TCALIF_13289-PA protein Name:"Similar to Leng9 Leukocyte receptor cluster member 9 (Mus musculus)" AED:0.00 eAED:0.00 QI:80/1/1/1/0.5/0.33/3/63/366